MNGIRIVAYHKLSLSAPELFYVMPFQAVRTERTYNKETLLLIGTLVHI